MKADFNRVPREFQVGGERRLTMRDCGSIELEADEQVTFVTESDSQYDVARKNWGYYATPSTNGRLRDHNLRTALVMNATGRLYVMLVESGMEMDFFHYLRREEQRLLTWLDTDESVQRLERLVTEGVNFRE